MSRESSDPTGETERFLLGLGLLFRSRTGEVPIEVRATMGEVREDEVAGSGESGDGVRVRFVVEVEVPGALRLGSGRIGLIASCETRGIGSAAACETS